MPINGILGILLHTTVDRGVHLQTIGIDVVGLAILLRIFVTPSVKRVVNPSNGVVNILRFVPFGIVALIWSFRHKVLTKELTKVSGRAILMIGAMEVQRKRFFSILTTLGIRQITCLNHLSQYHVTTFLAPIRITYRVEKRWILAQSDKRCSLGNVKIFGLLIKIGVSCGLYSHSVM